MSRGPASAALLKSSAKTKTFSLVELSFFLPSSEGGLFAQDLKFIVASVSRRSLSGLSSRQRRIRTMFTIPGFDPRYQLSAVYYRLLFITGGDINFIKRAPLAHGREIDGHLAITPGFPTTRPAKKRRVQMASGRATRAWNLACHERRRTPSDISSG